MIMKKNKVIYIYLLGILLFTNCKSFTKNTSNFIDNLMFNDELYYSLKVEKDNVIIYDKNKELIKNDREFSKDNIFIKFTISKPLSCKYFVVYKVIIDKKLAFIVLQDSEGKKNYTYYLIKNDNNKTWHITNVEVNNTR